MSALEDAIRRVVLEGAGLKTVSPELEARIKTAAETYEAARQSTAGQLLDRESQTPAALEAQLQRGRNANTLYDEKTGLIEGRQNVKLDGIQKGTDIRVGAQKELMGSAADALYQAVGGSWMDVAAQTNDATQKLLDTNVGYKDRQLNAITGQMDKNRALRQRGQTFDFLKDLAVTGYMIFGD